MPLASVTDKEQQFFTTLSGWFAPNGGVPPVSYQAPPGCTFTRTSPGTFLLSLPPDIYNNSTIQTNSLGDGMEVYFGNCKGNGGEAPVYGSWFAIGLPNFLFFTTDAAGVLMDFAPVAGRKVTYMIRMKYLSQLTF